MKKLDLVLVIDDDPTSLFLTERRLKRTGLAEKVLTAQRADEALNHIQEHCGRTEYELDCPSLILVDIRMPVMDGFELVKKVKKLPLSRKPVIAMLSTSLNDDDLKVAQELAVDGYFPKPLEVDKLYDFIARVIPKKK